MIIALALAEPAAVACSLVGPTPLVIVPSDDAMPPAIPMLGEPEINRGRGPRGFLIRSSTSCDDIGWIDVSAASTDDTTPAEELGFEVEVLDGELPDGLTLPDGPLTYFTPGTLSWTWLDGATNDQEPFSFVVAVTAVDLAGNRSDSTQVTVTDEGHNGCATSPFGGLLGALLAAASLRLHRR